MMVLALLLLGHGVQAAETVILTLSCDGTATNMMSNSDNKPEPITKMGLLVNFPVERRAANEHAAFCDLLRHRPVTCVRPARGQGI
jgi:hypothetical protein